MEFSPSAFLPFCDFGNNMSLVGNNIEEFDVPVCNCFKEKVLYDQLCYEVDLEKYRDPTDLKNQLRIGLTFILDYNTDRHLSQDLINTNLNLREAFIKKKTKKLKFFRKKLKKKVFSEKVKNFFFHFFLKLDHIWGTFGKNYFFPLESLVKIFEIAEIREITPKWGYFFHF